MAPIQTNTIFSAKAGHQRGTQPLSDIDHDKIANAIRYLSYAKLYYPLEYGFFTKSLATRGATESMEDSNYILALYDFEIYFSEFLRKHPGVEQDINRLSPKEMVDRVNEELVEGARARRDAIRKASQRIVNKTIEQQGLKLNKSEKAEAEKAVGAAMQASIDGSPTTKEFLRSIEEGVAPVMLTQIPTVDKGAVTHVVGTVLRENPKEIQRIFLSDEKSQKEILERTMFSQLPNKRALHSTIDELPMDPDETKKQFFDRAESVARTAMVISSDLSQTPEARIEPGGLVSAILEATGNKTALKAFERLTEQAKNAVSLTVVAKAWEDTVDIITKRAGGAIAQNIEPILQEANKQPVGGSIKQVASLVGDVISPLLGRTFTNIVELEALNRSLPPGQKLLSDKNSVVTFIESLDAARRAEGAASAALFLTVTTHYPGVQFMEQRSDNPLAPVVTVVQFAKDSVVWKIFDRAAKSEVVGGFFGKILRPVLGFFGIKAGGAAAGAAGAAATKIAGEGVKQGAAALLTKLGLSALAGVFTGGTSLLAQAAVWVGGSVLGGAWRAGARLLSARWLTSLLGFGTAPDAHKQWYEQDWVPIMIIVGVAVLIPMFGAMMQTTTLSSALVTSFEASALAAGGPYTEAFPVYNGPFPSGPTSVTTCAVNHKNLTQKPFDSGGKGTHKNTCAYDFNAQWMSPVVATHDGCVAFVRTDIENNKKDTDTYGNVVILAGKNQDGSVFYSRYAHLAQNTSSHLSKEQCITAGTPIGNVDNTGNSTGTHLHLEFLDENMGYVTPEQCFAAFSLPGCTQ